MTQLLHIPVTLVLGKPFQERLQKAPWQITQRESKEENGNPFCKGMQRKKHPWLSAVTSLFPSKTQVKNHEKEQGRMSTIYKSWEYASNTAASFPSQIPLVNMRETIYIT